MPEDALEYAEDMSGDGERRVAEVVQQAREAVDRAQRSRPFRVWQQYSDNDGTLLAAGMSYQSVFAIFAAVWVGFSIAGIWIRANQDVYDALIKIINEAVPGLIGDHGAISDKMLDQAGTTLGITGIIAALSLIWTAVGWLGNTRTAVRSMFGLGRDERNFLLQKVVDFALALVFGIGLVASAAVSVASSQFLTIVFGWFGLSDHSPITKGAVAGVGYLVVIGLNLLTLMFMYRVLSRVVIPMRNLFVGSLIGAIALGILSVASGLLLGGASKNPWLATFAVFVALMIWFNLVCNVILFCASWISVGMRDRGLSPRRLSEEERALELARRAYRERIEEAATAVRDASAAYDAARGFRRWPARRALFRSYQRLNLVRAGDPDRPAVGGRA